MIQKNRCNRHQTPTCIFTASFWRGCTSIALTRASSRASSRASPPPGYRKNKATFHAVPPARVRPPPATLRPLGPTPGGGPPAPRCPPGAGLARACPEAPTPAPGQPCREPAGHRPAPQGPARTAAGQPARLGLRGGDCGSGTAFSTAGAHPPGRPRATARGLPQRTSVQWRPPYAASAGRQTAAAGPAWLG
jgi:hypothetical protein